MAKTKVDVNQLRQIIEEEAQRAFEQQRQMAPMNYANFQRMINGSQPLTEEQMEQDGNDIRYLVNTSKDSQTFILKPNKRNNNKYREVKLSELYEKIIL